jgi:hypothetical protein
MKTRFILISVVLLYWTSVASSDYVLVLKNGRRITVQSYREEGSMIKFHGLGGEIGISKDQIQSIQKDGDKVPGSVDLMRSEEAPSPPAKEPIAEQKKASPTTREEKAPASDDALAEQRAKEEKEYQQTLKEITEQLKEVRDRYSNAVRGTTSKDPTLLTTEEQLKARTDDVIARQQDAQQNPPDPGVLRLLTQSPFSTHSPGTTELRAPAPVGPSFATPPPTYTDRQKELSDLRNQAIQLEKERERLINEMKQKNFDTGSLFLE